MKIIHADRWGDIPHDFTGLAYQTDGTEVYIKDGVHHRVEGPTVILPNGRKRWALEGEEMSEEEHTKRTAPYRTTLGKLILNEHFKLDE